MPGVGPVLASPSALAVARLMTSSVENSTGMRCRRCIISASTLRLAA
jgi:hypothetical protein